MRAFLRTSLVLGASLWIVASTTPLHAQEEGGSSSDLEDEVQEAMDAAQEYQERFDNGIDALSNGRYQEGIDDFTRCLELAPEFPQNSICAYNVACGYSLMEEIDSAFEWLERSATMGFGQVDGNIEHTGSDGDLANARADAERWAGFQERMSSINETIAAYTAQPAIYVPEAIAELEQKPILLVLHDFGERKEDVVAGDFRAVADQLGMALVVPSGGFAPIESDPANGMSWIDEANGYAQNIFAYQRGISEAMRYVRTEIGMDRRRVLIVGIGQGSILAVNVAVSSPGLYKGVVAVGYNPLFLQLAQGRGPNAGRMGLKARFLYGDIPGQDMESFVQQALLAQVEPWGLDVGHAIFDTEASEGERAYGTAMLAALRECLPVEED